MQAVSSSESSANAQDLRKSVRPARRVAKYRLVQELRWVSLQDKVDGPDILVADVSARRLPLLKRHRSAGRRR